MVHISLLNTTGDGCRPSDYKNAYHIHILVREGEMRFSDGKNAFLSRKDDLVIWQMSNTIQEVSYSEDFEADFLIVSGEFLSRFNPEMVWASKGFIFIRINPSFHLHDLSLKLLNDDFALFRQRLGMEENPFREEILGRVMQIFLYDLWTVYSAEMSLMEANEMRPAFSCASSPRFSRTAAVSATWPTMPTSSASRRSISPK